MTLRKVRADLTDTQDNRYQVILYNPNGGSRYKKTVRGKSAAKRHHNEMAVKLRSGGVAVTEERNKTFREFTVEYLATRNLGPQTRRNYDNALRLHLYPALGDVKISSLALKKLLLDGILTKIEKQAGAGQRRNAETLLRTVLNNAVAAGVLDRNPYGGIKRPKAGRVKGSPYRIDIGDAVRVRDHALKPRPGTFEEEREQHAALFVTLIGTGLRIGEALGIDPVADIDSERKVLRVVRQVQYINPRLCEACRQLSVATEACLDCEQGGYIYCPPKGNDASKREVPLPQFVTSAISALQLRNGLATITLPWSETTGDSQTHALLFHSLRSPDKPLNQAGFSNVVARTGKALKLPRALSAHSFRHRYTSVLANARVPQIVIDTITGHKPTGSVTHEVYTEAEQTGIDMARDAIETAWEQAQLLAAKPVRLHAV
jgi:integrase